MGKAGIVQTVSGGKVEDSVNLNANGTVTKNGETLDVNSNLKFDNIAGSSFQSCQTEGNYIGLTMGFAFGGGFGFSFGHVSDATGGRKVILIWK